MATLTAYLHGGSMGLAGGRAPCRRDARLGFLGDECCRRYACDCRKRDRLLCCRHAPAKRGRVNGWSRGSVRRHLAWLQSVDVEQLDGDGFGLTLTLRDTPASHTEWHRLVKALCRAMKDAGFIRWHYVTEWQRRGTPHLHLAVYAPPGWESPISDSSAGEWAVRVWLKLAADYRPGLVGQACVPIGDALGWEKYLSKHASRGVDHYQRQGTPPGWTSTGRLWGHSAAGWPVVEPMRLELTDPQLRRMRRLVRAYVVADARRAALAARPGSAEAERAWSRVKWARRMLRCNDRGLSAVRGISASWVPRRDLLQLAEFAGWTGELKMTVTS